MDKSKRTLILVESPNKCSTIAKILKDGGFTSAVVKASFGHFTEIKDGGTYWNTGIYPDQDFKTDLVISSKSVKPGLSYRDVVKDLREQVAMAEQVIICSDPDREGEAIAWTLKKFLNIPEKKYFRASFSEITSTAVLHAIDNAAKIDMNLANAANARRIWDKILGYRLSPRTRKDINAKSMGRCQGAGMAIIGAREKEINEFVPEKYTNLYLHFNKEGREFKAKYFGTTEGEIKRLSNEQAKEVVADCQSGTYCVDSVEKKKSYSNPKSPFITSTFQQEVSTKLKIGVKTANDYAQRLFEGIEINGEHKALITYIRTDNPEFSKDFLPELESFVKNNYGEEYYHEVRKEKKGENAQEGHEAIRPVDLNMTPELLSKYIHDDKLIKVYSIIYKRTVACAMASSITSETIYHIKNGKHVFNLVSKELVFDGYTKVYTYADKDSGDICKESFIEGEVIGKDMSPSLILEDKETTPPPRFKEATFIKELEDTGNGRPATYAKILDTITSDTRGYCTIQDDYIVPTELGLKLIDYISKNFSDILNIDYTKELEKDLDKIATGKLDYVDFLTECYNDLEKSMEKFGEKPKAKSESKPTNKKCPQCGGELVERSGPYGKFLGCKNYPKCKYIEKLSK